MIRFTREKVLLLHQIMGEATGGAVGVRDEDCWIQPWRAYTRALTVRNSIRPKKKKERGSDIS